MSKHYLSLLLITTMLITACGESSGKKTPLSTEKLIAAYPFSGDANDTSDHQAHGIIKGAKLTKDRHGKAESALSFDGLNDFVEVPAKRAIALNLSKQLTFEAWINISGYFKGRLFPILSKGVRAPRYSFMAANDGNFYVVLDNNVIALADNNVMKLNRWYHIAVTWNGSSVKYYRDGKFVSRFAYSGALTLAENEPLLIGFDPQATVEFANGKIDEVRLWDKVLTAYQIKDSM
ncbi:MAG: LamG domain-containing protein [Cocleimonas sp.]|nr:LamG domain-containing protein [Cocleimonas sp.]